MSTYTVTVVDRHHRRHSYPMIATGWYECWKDAANRFGIACLVMVKPWKPT